MLSSCSKASLASVSRGRGVGGSGVAVDVSVEAVGSGEAGGVDVEVEGGIAVGDGSGSTQQPTTKERKSAPSTATTSLVNFVIIICVSPYDTPSLSHCQNTAARGCVCTWAKALCAEELYGISPIARSTSGTSSPVVSRSMVRINASCAPWLSP